MSGLGFFSPGPGPWAAQHPPERAESGERSRDRGTGSREARPWVTIGGDMSGTNGIRGMQIHRAALVVAVLASLILTLAGPAQATRMLGTKGSERIVGTAKADVIKAGGGNDRVRGGRGRDRLFGGRGKRPLERRRWPARPSRQRRAGQGRLQDRRGRSRQHKGLRDREDRERPRSRRRRSRRSPDLLPPAPWPPDPPSIPAPAWAAPPPGGRRAHGGRPGADLQRCRSTRPRSPSTSRRMRSSATSSRSRSRRCATSPLRCRARPPSSLAAHGVALISPTTQVFDATRAAAHRRRGHGRVARC